jgi:hypothetical protein
MASNVIAQTVGSDCSPRMEQLRREGFPPQSSVQFTFDEFDGRSSHVCHWSGEMLIGMIRLTPGPDSMFERWTARKAVIPVGADVVDLNRVVVATQYRRMGVFKLIMLDSLLRAATGGFNAVVGATKPRREILPSMYQMGFESTGPVVLLRDPTSGPFEIQPCAVFEVGSRVALWREMYNEIRVKVEAQVYQVSHKPERRPTPARYGY